ncbi:MAG TPA: DUF4157 domain-containing protein [Pyrinomonadaceae bacterium]|nr:DUF4157 domain-containing protein [Pyrinomonadaceae bacterium]
MAQLRDELTKTESPLERRNVEEYQPLETPGSHHSLLQLQRRAGNRAVVSLFEGASLSSAAPRIQRAPANGASPAPETAAPTSSGPLIVADDAATVGPAQMRKSEFLEQLRGAVCTTADQVLAEVGQNTEGCPYIEQWLSYYADQEPAHVERALRKYAPEAASATSARDYIPAVSNRVRRGVETWARTGELTDIPPELAGVLPTGGGALGAVAGVLGGIGSAIGGAVSAVGSAIGGAFSSLSSALFKTKDGSAPVSNDPQEIQQQLSEGGQPLDSTVNSRMSAAFAHDFSNVRVHSNAQAAELSAGLNARAFTIGSDIAFAGGEYQPGTLVGDALIAHELAHVVQQQTGAAAVSSKNEQTSTSALEDEADVAAVNAVASIWGGTRLTGVAGHAMPRLKSGLKLQSCGPEPTPKNRYEEFVVEGTKKLQDPPFAFGLPWEGIKCGEDVAGEKKPFDEEFWTSQWVDPNKKNECMLVNKKPPSAAIEALFDPARRNKWHIDCTIFTQLPHLYAQLRTFGPQEFNKRLSNRIELRKEFSTGLKSRIYWVEGSRRGVLAEAILDEGGHPVTEIVRGTDDLTSAKVKPNAVERPADDVLKEVPVGSRVTFATYPIPNLFAALKPVLDNTVKMADNYYAAHDVPAGKDGMYTKEEIQELLGTKYNRPKQNVQVVLVEVREVP